MFDVAASPDRLHAASAGADGIVRLWDLKEGQVLRRFTGHLRPVWSLVFSPDGTLLVSAGSDEVVRVWDLPTGREVGTSRKPILTAGDQAEETDRGAIPVPQMQRLPYGNGRRREPSRADPVSAVRPSCRHRAGL